MKDRTTRFAEISTIIMLGIAIFAIFQNTTTISDTKKSIDSLNEIVKLNSEQLKRLDKAIQVLNNQTIIDAYSTGGKFSIKFHCISTLDSSIILVPMVLDDRGSQTIVPFEIHFIFLMYGRQNNGEYEQIGDYQSSFQYNPLEVQRDLSLPMTTIYSKAESNEYDDVKINVMYLIIPRLSEKPSVELDYRNLDPHLLTNIENEDGIWKLQVTNDSLCSIK